MKKTTVKGDENVKTSEEIETARLKKNASQREYSKRTNYAANAKYAKANSKKYTIRFFKSTDARVIEKLDGEKNKTNYIRQLILADISKEKCETSDS